MKFISGLFVWIFCALPVFAGDYHVYFGTFNGAKSQGIYVSRFDPDSGKLSAPELAIEIKNPGFLAVHPNKRFLYAVGEMKDAQGKRIGAVSALTLDSKTGKLVVVNQQSCGGDGPCHVAVDASGKCLLVANYGSGSVASLPIQKDGSLGAAVIVMKHTGSGAHPQRQSGPHAHQVMFSPDNRFALSCDLGLDKVLLYKLDAATATLTTNQHAFGSVARGAGPRHLAFSPDGKNVYVVNELNMTLTAFAYDAKTAEMTEAQTLSTLPAGREATEADTAAQVIVHPSGRFVYSSNRGHDSIAVFSRDGCDGKLALIQNESTQGKTPRNFAIDPEGHWLLAENQNSDTVVVFAIDQKTGKLKATGQTISVGSPVCAVFVRAE